MRRVSILIPTYNEEGIAESLDALTAHVGAIAAKGKDVFEIVLVDDSRDEMRALIREYITGNEGRLAPRIALRLVPGERRGKGNAIKLGALASTGDVVFTMDADLPVPLENIERFLARFDEGYEVVVAERPFDRNMTQPVRFVASRVLFAMQRYFVFQADVFRDTQCGFKAFTGEVARSLAARQIVDGGMYDIEYLYVATREHRRVARLPVTPRPETRPSKINAWRCLMTDPRDLARVKMKGVTGGYRHGR